MRKSKKITVFILFALLCTFLFGMSAAAYEQEGDWNYAEVTGGVEIQRYVGSNLNVVIPDTLGEKPVVSIGDGAFYVSDIESVDIPASVKRIDEQAFSYCRKLEKVTFRGDGLLEIRERAFESCRRLVQFDFPKSLKKIEECAFIYCPFSENVDLSKTAITTMERAVFWNCPDIVTISLPSGISEVPDDFCEGCDRLETVIINGKNVKIIGESAFAHCPRLKTVNIPDSVVDIGTYAFSNCDRLTDVTIPSSVTNIGYYAFQSGGLKTVHCVYGSYAYHYFKEFSGVNVIASGTYLAQSAATIYVGEKVALQVVNYQPGTVFTSSNPKVVSVDSKGVVKGVKTGTATITAKCGGIVTSCKVKVQKLKLNYTKAKITEGFTLKLSLPGSGKVKWKSSDKSIATVTSKGVVKAKKAGKVTITATRKGKKYTCKVTVQRNEKSFNVTQNFVGGNIALTKLYKEGSSYVGEFLISNDDAWRMTAIQTLDINIYADGNYFLSKSIYKMPVSVPASSQGSVRIVFSGSEIKKKKVDMQKTGITYRLSNYSTWHTYYY